MGILQGVILKLSEAHGCHDIPHIRQIFIQGIWLMLCSALVSIGLLYLFRDLPKLFGASEHVVSITKNCIWVLVFILPAHLLMRLCTALSQVTENAHKVLLSDSIFSFLNYFVLSFDLWCRFIFNSTTRCHRGFVSHSHCTVVYVGYLLPVFPREKLHFY